MHWRFAVVLSTAVLCIGCLRASPRLFSPPASAEKSSLHAPSDSQDTRPDRPPFPWSSPSRVGLWYGRSALSGGVLGNIPSGTIRLLGIQYQRRLLPTSARSPSQQPALTLSYTVDAIPVASVHIPKEAAPDAYFTGGPSGQSLSTRGLGMYPVGLQMGFRPASAVRPFVTGHTGLMYFLAPVPDARGKQLNFAAGIGGGVEVVLPHRTSLTLAYRYHHLSNGFRGSINPGLDANMLYFGVGIAL